MLSSIFVEFDSRRGREFFWHLRRGISISCVCQPPTTGRCAGAVPNNVETAGVCFSAVLRLIKSVRAKKKAKRDAAGH